MKPLTSWTRQSSSRDKCPKRFFLRYLEPTGIATRFHGLKSVRELGGHVVHVELARIVKALANGDRISDHQDGGLAALESFNHVVGKSAALPAWTLAKECQVAEFHNGQNPIEEIEYWREIIPVCIENGLRVMHTLGLRSDAGERSMLAEEEIRFQRSGRAHRCVIDVLVRDKRDRTVIDWKCHSITNADVQQVRFYQDYIAKAEQIPYSRLYGFAVDLLREEIMPAHFRPHDPPPNNRHPSRLIVPERTANPYASRSSLENCSRCPFAAICADSAVKPTRPVSLLKEVA